MATTAQLTAPTEAAGPVALWHLLSFDAPTIAALWTWFIARACHLSLPLASLIAMALAVWALYAIDRLLDARHLDRPQRSLLAYPHPPGPDLREKLEARHLFHHRHRHAFLAGIVAALAGVAILLPRLNPVALRLYLVEGASLVVWFLILHATRSAHRLPKEIAVGLFFSAAVFIPTVARQPTLSAPWLRVAMLTTAALFAALCSLNCLFIYAWEHHGPSTPREPSRPAHPTTRLALAHLHVLTIAIVVASTAVAIIQCLSPRHIELQLPPAACAISATLLLALDRHRARFSPVTLRAAADLALLTPILFLPFLR